MSDIEARVKKIIAEQLGVEESQVTNAYTICDFGLERLACNGVQSRVPIGCVH